MRKVERFFERDKRRIMEYSNKIVNENDFYPVLSELYLYVNSVINDYFGVYFGDHFYDSLKAYIYEVEEKYANLKLIDPAIYYDDYKDNGNIVERIVHETRNFLIKEIEMFYFKPRLLNIKNLNLTNCCLKAASYVDRICQRENIKSHLIKIHPGYDEYKNLYNGAGFHWLNIIEVNNKYYLVDTTFQQFFYSKRNNLDRISVMGLSGCQSGRFMLMSSEGKNLAIELLKNGYCELDEKKFKLYFDSFTVSFRNGLYYESTNDYSFNSVYSVDDYIRFLRREDSQVRHEGEENLGYQKRPLKNGNLKFYR